MQDPLFYDVLRRLMLAKSYLKMLEARMSRHARFLIHLAVAVTAVAVSVSLHQA